MSDLAAHAPRAGAQSKALKKAEGGGGQIYVRCGVARLPICPGDTRSGKCAARPCRLQSTCAGVHGPVRASPPRPPRAVLENTNSLIRTVPYVERTADITERIRDEPRRRCSSRCGPPGTAVNRKHRREPEQPRGTRFSDCERHNENAEHFALLPRLLLMRNSRPSFIIGNPWRRGRGAACNGQRGLGAACELRAHLPQSPRQVLV